MLLPTQIVIRFNELLERKAVSALSPGVLSEVTYAQKLVSPIPALFSFGVNHYYYATFSSTHFNNRKHFWDLFTKGAAINLGLGLFTIAIGYAVGNEVVFKLLFGERFNELSIIGIQSHFRLYLIWLLIAILSDYTSKILYSRIKPKIILITGVSDVLIGFSLRSFLLEPYQGSGLIFSQIGVYLASVIIQCFVLYFYFDSKKNAESRS
jgi:peptidoglycan biosynthesis protein MviN/MurJ (putative lipid II flippase)